jgi:tripartite-type tricarboxylate transporter receptor subunit TctC
MRALNFVSGATAALFLAMPFLVMSSASAQTPAEFYKGKTIELDIGTSAGGGYDVHSRLLARHMSKYVPGNPTIVPKNVEGASGVRLANLLYNTAPHDGTVFGILLRNVPFEPMFGNRAAQFDASKFTWIGSASNEVSICVSWHTTGVATLNDLLTKDLVVGGIGPGADLAVFPKIINGVLGTRMKVINGYAGGNEVMLAMERGELGGRCAWSWSAAKATRQDWIDQKQINIFAQTALRKHPELTGVPLVLDYAKTDEDRSIFKLVFARQEFAWPYIAPPGVPSDRIAALRKGFMDTMKDPQFLADAEKAKLEIMPVPGEEIERLVGELYATPAEIVQKTIEMMK